MSLTVTRLQRACFSQFAYTPKNLAILSQLSKAKDFHPGNLFNWKELGVLTVRTPDQIGIFYLNGLDLTAPTLIPTHSPKLNFWNTVRRSGLTPLTLHPQHRATGSLLHDKIVWRAFREWDRNDVVIGDEVTQSVRYSDITYGSSIHLHIIPDSHLGDMQAYRQLGSLVPSRPIVPGLSRASHHYRRCRRNLHHSKATSTLKDEEVSMLP